MDAARRREAEERAYAAFDAMLPRALEVVQEMAVSPHKRTADAGRRLLARYEAEIRSTKEQEGAHTRAAS